MTSRHIKYYSAQKNKETGNGYYSKAYNINLENIDQVIKDARDEQRKMNKDYKEKIKKGIEVPQLYFPKQTLVVERADVGPSENRGDDVGVIKGLAEDDPTPTSNIARTPFKLKLDPGTGNTIFILGSSKMGKSTALMKIYDEYYDNNKYISILWTVNPQIKLYKGHKKLLKAGVWNQNSEEIIKEQKKIQTGTGNKYQFLNMFDDVINIRNNTLLDNLILTYRNSDMSSIISLQYSNLMSKCGRANCNNILVFGFNTDESIEVVVKTFLTGYLKKLNITNLGDQINWYKSATEDHSFIYIKPADGTVSFHRFRA
jgi:hypothetical protein